MSDILAPGTTEGGEASAESHFLEPDFSGLTSWVLISYNWMDVREFNAGVLSARWLQARRRQVAIDSTPLSSQKLSADVAFLGH